MRFAAPALRSYGFWATAAVYLGGAAIVQAVNLAAQPVFAYFMSPAEWGIAASYVFWMTAFGLLIGLQVHAVLNNVRTSRGAEELPAYMGTVMPLYLLPFALLVAALAVAPDFWSSLLALPAPYLLMAIVNGLLFAVGAMAMSHAVCVGHRRSYLVLLVGNTVAPIGIGLVLVLLMPDRTELARILGYLGGAGVMAIGVATRVGRPRVRRTPAYVPFALGIALPLLAHELLFLVMNQSNRIFLLKLVDETAAGVFAFAYGIGNTAVVAAVAINNGWTPWYFTKTQAVADADVRRTAGRLVLLFATFVSAVALVSPEALRLITREAYWDGARIVPMLLVAGHLLFVFNLAANFMVFRRRTRLVLAISGVGCLVNVGLNLALVPVWSITGAAVASLASTAWLAVAALVLDRYVLDCRNLPYRQIVASLSIAALAVATSHFAFTQAGARFGVAAMLLVAVLAWGVHASRGGRGRDGTRSEPTHA